MRSLKRLPPHLFKHWAGVASRIQASRRVVVFLDFDGTLVRIAPRPDAVSVSLATRGALRRLVNHPRVTLAVISGRRRAELLQYVDIPGIHYLGLYGWEHSGTATVPLPTRNALRSVLACITSQLGNYPGLWIEDKQLSLSIHYRTASPAVQRSARNAVRTLLLPFHRFLRLLVNLREVEIVPRIIFGKGIAATQFLAKPVFRRAVPLYFGDDLSDEPAFSALRKGVSICVGAARKTRASYSLRGPAEVTTALFKLEAALA
jgi:trehalose 6-phosphate phosphatase